MGNRQLELRIGHLDNTRGEGNRHNMEHDGTEHGQGHFHFMKHTPSPNLKITRARLWEGKDMAQMRKYGGAPSRILKVSFIYDER